MERDTLLKRKLFLQEMGIEPEWLPKDRLTIVETPAKDETANTSLERLVEIPTEQASLDTSSKTISVMDWETLEHTVFSCQRCQLCHTRTQTVFGTGPRTAEWMVIGEAPGEHEDRQGQPFVGQAGKLLDNMLSAIGLNRIQNVYIANILKCRPPGNRNPNPQEIADCTPYLQRQIALVKPKCILLMGRFAAQTLLRTDVSISKLRGQVYSYENIPTIVTYHPAYLLRSPQEKAKAWIDLCLAQNLMKAD
jgi:uracil-DNA glycosylase family 4